MPFRYFLNDGQSSTWTQLQNEPDGWEDIKIKISRDEKLRGLFVVFASDVVLWGDGYRYLINVLKEQGVCGTLYLRIQKEPSENAGFTDFYSGQIYLKDVDFNATKCTAKCKVEDANLTAVFMANLETIVQIDNGETVNKNPLTDIAETFQIHDATNGVHSGATTGYFVKDLMDYLCRYITDNRLVVDSTYLSSGNFQVARWEIDYGGVLSNGDHVVATFINGYNQTKTIDFFINNTPLPPTTYAPGFTYLAYIREAPGARIKDTYFEFYFPDALGQDCSGVSSGIKATVDGWTKDWDLQSVTVNGTPVTVTLCQPFEYRGAYPFLLTSVGHQYSVDGYKFTTTLREVIDTLIKCFGCAFRIIDVAGQPTLKIEHVSDFFTSSAALALNNVNNVTYKVSDKMLFKDANVGENINPDIPNVFARESYVSPLCIGDGMELERDNVSAWPYYPGNINLNEKANSKMIFHVFDDSGTWKTVSYRETQGNTSSQTTQTWFWYNVPIINLNVLYKNEFGMPGDLNNGKYQYKNSGAQLQLRYLYEFECPVTDAQFKAMVNTPSDKVVFNGKVGWLYEMEYEVKTQIAKFKVFTE